MTFNVLKIIIFILPLIFPKYILAFDKDLKLFKTEIEETLILYEKKFERLKKSKLIEGQKIDDAAKQFIDLLKYSSDKLNSDDIYTAIESLDFLTKNIDAAIKIIPPETITTLENVNFSEFSEIQSEILNEVMTGMNRKKMVDFKEMVTKIVVLEKEGFKAENFMSNLQNLDMGLAMLNDDTLDLEFELAGLSKRNLNDIAKDLEQLDKNIQKLNMQKVTENIENVSTDLDNTASNVQTQLSSTSNNIDQQINTNTISTAANEVSSSLSNDNISSVTSEVSQSLTSTNITEVTENISQNVANSTIVNATEVLENTDVIVDAAEVLQNSDVIVDAAEVLQNSDVIVDSVSDYDFSNVYNYDYSNSFSGYDFGSFNMDNWLNSLPTMEESMNNLLTNSYKSVEKIGEQKTSIFSDMAQQNLQQWVNPNAECWTTSSDIAVECNY